MDLNSTDQCRKSAEAVLFRLCVPDGFAVLKDST